jgi:3-deoxy-7-phosphoheptulonate synthase
MIVEMRRGASQDQVDAVVARAAKLGFEVQLNVGTDKVVVAILGSDTGRTPTETFEVLPGVESVTRIMRPYKLASREFRPEPTLVHIPSPRGEIVVGGPKIVVMAGPCSVESHAQLLATAQHVLRTGASVVRGGAYKPRTSPFSFQGLGEEGLYLLSQIRQELGVPVVSEITEPESLDTMLEHIDVLQIGTRNMQNYGLLRAVGQSGRPCILKRGLAATVTEWLQAADYLLAAGGTQVILCERGIRTFENSTRFTLDISAIGVIKRNSHLPVIIDPSHAAGHYELVPSLARAAVAAGADGLLIEVHPDPANALSDGLQSLTFSDFERLMGQLKAIAAAVGRSI